MAEHNHDSVSRQERVVRVDEHGLLVGSLNGPGEQVTIGVTHRYVAYWDIGGPMGICNTCGQLRPKQVFGGDYPKGSCPLCGHSAVGGNTDDRAGGEVLATRGPLSPQDLQEIVDDELAKAAAEQREWQAEQERLMGRRRGPSDDLLAALRPADRTDYGAWMEGYLQSGARPTHAYTYPFPLRNWYVATADFIVDEPLHGAHAVEIIVPAGIRWSAPVGLGHSNLYLMENFTNVGGWVPLYQDMRFV